MLGMGEVESGIDFIKNVHWRWLELEKGHDERKRDQGPAQHSSVIMLY
jgi:hypothetical protein